MYILRPMSALSNFIRPRAHILQTYPTERKEHISPYSLLQKSYLTLRGDANVQLARQCVSEQSDGISAPKSVLSSVWVKF